MIGIPLGLLYANAGEWLIHKHVLHGLGRSKQSPWSFHWHEHHRNSRQGDPLDEAYERPLLGWHAQTKEALALGAAAAMHVPLFPVAPFFTGAVWYSIWNYYRVHKKAHQDADWAKEHLPWHYDHHMGPNQDTNWCVSRPWFDHIMGTREPYLGTERELQDRQRRLARKSEQAAKQAAKQAAASATEGAG
jgi:sterol desaturase/sphingolipid hydroxylase (fatty acid hydroxylase superfamily)